MGEEMTEQQIFDLLRNIRRFENRDGEFFKGWQSALDTVETDFREYFREKEKQ